MHACKVCNVCMYVCMSNMQCNEMEWNAMYVSMCVCMFVCMCVCNVCNVWMYCNVMYCNVM